MVYHTIVKSVVRKNFEKINNHQYSLVAKDCSPNIKHRFGGDHALGGARETVAVFEKWMDRLGRVAPGLRLTVTDIWVKGWPWDTTAIVRWTAADTLPDGSPYANHGVHIVHMAWGKVDNIDANEDSQAVARMLEARYKAGMEEAGAPPLTS